VIRGSWGDLGSDEGDGKVSDKGDKGDK